MGLDVRWSWTWNVEFASSTFGEFIDAIALETSRRAQRHFSSMMVLFFSQWRGEWMCHSRRLIYLSPCRDIHQRRDVSDHASKE